MFRKEKAIVLKVFVGIVKGACGKQPGVRLIVWRSHILHGHDHRILGMALAGLKESSTFCRLDENTESRTFLQNNIRLVWGWCGRRLNTHHCQAIFVQNNDPVGKCTRHIGPLWPPWEVPTPFLFPSIVSSSAGEVKDVTSPEWRWDPRRRKIVMCSI